MLSGNQMNYGQQIPAGLTVQQMSGVGGVRGMSGYGPIPGQNIPMMGRINNPASQPMLMNQSPVVPMVESAPPTSSVPAPSQPSQQQQPQPAQAQKELNTASLCRLGQDAVQDIIAKTTDLFQQLKSLHLPTNSPQTVTMQREKKEKIQDFLQSISMLFKRLRLIYDKCNENCAGMEYTHIESLIPIKDEVDARPEERKLTEMMKYVSEEHREIAEQVIQRSKHLKEIIDHLRNIIWEMTTMLATRRP
ncbi:Mediator of RNA polymerase II transcription subunit 30, variant 2 [Chamberlinius hualienensis]